MNGETMAKVITGKFATHDRTDPTRDALVDACKRHHLRLRSVHYISPRARDQQMLTDSALDCCFASPLHARLFAGLALGPGDKEMIIELRHKGVCEMCGEDIKQHSRAIYWAARKYGVRKFRRNPTAARQIAYERWKANTSPERPSEHTAVAHIGCCLESWRWRIRDAVVEFPKSHLPLIITRLDSTGELERLGADISDAGPRVSAPIRTTRCALVSCGMPIPPNRRSDALYCCRAHQLAARKRGKP